MHRNPRRLAAVASPLAPQPALGASGWVTIGQAAERSGVTAKMIRYYESLNLLPGIRRTQAGYRQYDDDDINSLRFIRRARDLGFDMKEVQQLLSLWHDRDRASRDVKRIAARHVDDLQRRIDAMTSMKRTLEHLVRGCRGDSRPSCPILDDLATAASVRQVRPSD